MAKYTSYFKSKIYCNILKNLVKGFTLDWAETYSEPFQAFKRLRKEITSLEVTAFTKSSIFDIWKGSDILESEMA